MRIISHNVTTVAISRLVMGAATLLFVVCPRASALDPSLELTQYTHRTWTAREGLKGSIRAIVQTPDGYLWLGTEFGLVRFDGDRFVPWSPPPGQHLPSSDITALLASRDGTLWIGSLQGLASWKNGALTYYPEINAGVPALLEDHEGTVWVGASGRLCSIRGGKTECRDLNGGLDTGLYYLYGNRGAGVFSLCEDHDHRLWAGTESGLWQWNPGPPRRLLAEPMNTQQGIVQGDRASDLIFVGGANDVVRQLSGDKIVNYAVPGVLVPLKAPHLLRDRDGGQWIGTFDHGLLRVYYGRTSRFALGEGLSGNLVTALFEDREGSIWVGTTNGIDRFCEPAVSVLSAYQGLRSPVWSVLPAHDGSLWIGSFDGLQRWNQGQLIIYRATGSSARQSVGEHPVSVNGFVREITAPELPGNYIGSLFDDQRGRVLITTSKGAAWFEDGRFTCVSGLPAGSTNAIFTDGHEGVWISYPAHGLFHVVDHAVVQSIPWPWPGDGKAPRLSAVVPDSTRELWVGTFDRGIALLKDGQVTKWLGSKDGLGADLVWNLYIDHEGTLWAATEGGLSRVKDGRVSTLTSKNGLPCNAVYWVIEDDAFSLWLSTACGLLRIDRSDLQAWASDAKHVFRPVIFDGSDGFRMHAMLSGYSPVVKKAPDGRLWFAHNDGVSVIDPQKLRLNKVPPPVHVEQITADGNTYAAAEGLRLPPRIRNLSIYYTALSLVAPEKVRFRFKLEGQDEGWREVVNGRAVQYSNLGPGNYRFRVIACNNSGVWNEAGDTLDFSIAPAYYQTLWFRLACVAAFLALLWALYQYRLRQVAQEFNMTLEARVGERTRIARDLHDTLLQSFHGLLLRFQSASNLLPERPTEAKQRLDSAIDQAAQAITEGRDAVQGLRASTVETNDLALALSTLGRELAAHETNRNSAVLRVDVEGTPRNLHPILRDEVYRIAGEALRNASRHAQARKIEVEIRYDDHELRLRVRDDGKGIDPNVLKEGGRDGHFGLRGMRERAKLVGGQLEVWSDAGEGTEVELSIPAKIAYAKAPPREKS